VTLSPDQLLEFWEPSLHLRNVWS